MNVTANTWRTLFQFTRLTGHRWKWNPYSYTNCFTTFHVKSHGYNNLTRWR